MEANPQGGGHQQPSQPPRYDPSVRGHYGASADELPYFVVAVICVTRRLQRGLLRARHDGFFANKELVQVQVLRYDNLIERVTSHFTATITNHGNSSRLKGEHLGRIFIRELGRTYELQPLHSPKAFPASRTDDSLGESRLAWELPRHSDDILATDYTASRE